jgi:hypothetical protein
MFVLTWHIFELKADLINDEIESNFKGPVRDLAKRCLNVSTPRLKNRQRVIDEMRAQT